MRLMVDTTRVTFMVSKAAEPKMELGNKQQKTDRETGAPQWVVEALRAGRVRRGGDPGHSDWTSAQSVPGSACRRPGSRGSAVDQQRPLRRGVPGLHDRVQRSSQGCLSPHLAAYGCLIVPRGTLRAAARVRTHHARKESRSS